MTPDPLVERVRENHRRARLAPPRRPAEVRADCKRAHDAVAAAAKVRQSHALNTDPANLERIELLECLDARLREAMVPLRSELGRVWRTPALVVEYGRDLHDATDAIKRERKKLWKMLNHPRAKSARSTQEDTP